LLFVLAEPQLTVAHVSANLETMLGVPVDAARGARLASILGAEQSARLEDAIRRGDSPTTMNPMHFVLRTPESRREFECVAYRSAGAVVVELEPYEMRTVPNPLDVFAHVRTPIALMEDAPDIATLVRDAAAAVREISGFDRAMVYRFDEDWHGDVISESTRSGVPVTYLGLRFPASDIPEQGRRLYHAIRCASLPMRITLRPRSFRRRTRLPAPRSTCPARSCAACRPSIWSICTTSACAPRSPFRSSCADNCGDSSRAIICNRGEWTMSLARRASFLAAC
jgi:light-regulated signal transduction histidine kinase (bacteriophytochrome)